MRLIIEVKRDADPQVVVNNLFLHSQLQTTFGVIMLALVNGVPKVVNLKEALEEYLKHRYEVITRRTRFDLRKAQEREHIYEGLKIAVDHLDAVIALIRGSPDTQTAKGALMEQFGLSEIQATEILDMRLARLTGLERKKIVEELEHLKSLIADLEDILARPERVKTIVKEELLAIKAQFGDERRTELIAEKGDFRLEDTIAEEEMVITVTHNGYIKRFPVSGYRRQRRGGKGLTGHIPREEDAIRHLFVASTHHYLLIFTNRGRLYWLKVHEIPSLARTARGRPIVNLIAMDPSEKIAALVNVDQFDQHRFLFLVTRKGIVKKVYLSEFSRPRRSGIVAMNLEEGDELAGADLTDGSSDILLGASNGKAVRFKESDVRPMGRYATGVTGMKLRPDERIVGMVVARREGNIFTCTELGYGKRTPLHEFRLTRRGAHGVTAHLINNQT
ncbi:MAG: DNA gyrase C-terminal beta-propeller domain-containing protein, partial [bacterium]